MARVVATVCICMVVICGVTGIALPTAVLIAGDGPIGMFMASVIGLACLIAAVCWFVLGALFDVLERIERNTRPFREAPMSNDDRDELDWAA